MVVGRAVDETTKDVGVAVQGSSAQDKIVRALRVPVLVLGGVDFAAAEHSLPEGHS